MLKTKSHKKPLSIIAAFVATIFMVVFSLGLAGPASAAPSHEGTDPQNTGCGNDAYTVTRIKIDFRPADSVGAAAVIAALPDNSKSYELRYSPSCQTNWIRYNIPSGAGGDFSLRGPNTQVGGLVNSSPWEYSGNYWTDQVYAPGTSCVETSVMLYSAFYYGQGYAVTC